MYSAGLVANETYTLKSEAEVITDAQLQPGTAQTTSVFYAQRTNIKSFEEFKYFTGVTKVLQRTFQGCNTMTSITLPNSVTELEDYVFQGCSALTDIIFSTSLLKLGSSTFAACSSLVTVILPKGFATIGSNTFIDCPSLESILIPASTNNIGDNVFMNCGKLHIVVDANNQTFKSVEGVLFNKAGTKLIEYAKETLQPEYEVPEGVTYVGNYAFYNRKGMTYIKFPSTLTRLGNDAISMCSNLKTLRFDGRTAPSLDNESVFGATNATYTGRDTYNTGVNKLYLSQLNATGFEDGLWLDPLQNTSKCGFSIHGKLVINTNRTNATFGVSYTAENGTAHSVTLRSGVSYLDDIKYGTSVTITPRELAGYTWEKDSETFTYSATSNSATLNAYVYPENATIIGEINPTENPIYTWSTTTENVDGEYSGTWSLSGAITSYISIGEQSTESCKLVVAEVPTETINGTLTLVLKYANGTTILTTTKNLAAILPGVIITSKSNAPIQASLYAAGLVANENYTLQSEVEQITEEQLNPNGSSSGSIFYAQRSNIKSFNEFQYFTGVTTIPKNTFYQCDYLTTIKLPSTITHIADQSFYYTTRLNSITLHEGLVSIGLNAFSFSGISTFNIPSSVTSIDAKAFPDASSSKNITINVSDANQTYSSLNGVLYNKSQSILYIQSRNDAEFATPNTVNRVASYAFSGSYTKKITLNEGISTIDSYAFSYSDITSISLPSTLISIGQNAFEYCYYLTDITIPKNVSSIGNQAFYHCSDMTSVTFEDGCKVMGKSMFSRCSDLENVKLSNNLTTIPYGVFTQCTSLKILTIPASVTRIENLALAAWYLGKIYCLATTAPTCADKNVFGTQNGASGQSAYTGGGVSASDRILFVPANATGYDSGYWTALTGERGFSLSATL